MRKLFSRVASREYDGDDVSYVAPKGIDVLLKLRCWILVVKIDVVDQYSLDDSKIRKDFASFPDHVVVELSIDRSYLILFDYAINQVFGPHVSLFASIVAMLA